MGNLWKQAEREAAKALGGKRVVRGDDFSQSKPDIEHPLFNIEVKQRKRLPVLLWNGLVQAASYPGGKPPLLVLRQTGDTTALVVMKMKDFVDLFGGIKGTKE